MLEIEAKKPHQTPLQEPNQDIICSKKHPTSSLAQGAVERPIDEGVLRLTRNTRTIGRIPQIEECFITCG
jgi:hypothetical protein